MKLNHFTSVLTPTRWGAHGRSLFCASAPRMVAQSLIAFGILAATAEVASARPQAADLEHFIIGEASLALGDCGAVMAQQSADYAEVSTPVALARASTLLSQTSGVTSDLATGLRFLCEQHGMASCESAEAFEQASADLALAASSITNGDYAQASVTLASATDQLEAIFSFDTENGAPDSLRESYRAARQSLDEASSVLAVLADSSTFDVVYRHVSGIQNEGLAAMLQRLQTPADFGWPRGFLDADLIVGSNYPGKWAPGTIHTLGLSHPVSQQILDSWSQTTSDQLLENLGGGALLLAVNTAGHNLRDALYGLRAYINEGHPVGISCVMVCQNDQDCQPCRIVEGGFGFAYANPADVDEARLLIRLFLSIEIKHRGISQPNGWLRDAVKDAIHDLVEQLQANSGHLYIRVEKERCVITSCWIFWDESECVKVKSGWLKVPLTALQNRTPPRMWTDAQFDLAARSAERVANQWCARN